MLKKLENMTAMRDAANALFELGIIETFGETFNLSDNLRDDLGLDSQEIVTIAEIASSLCIARAPLSDTVLKTTGDLIQYITANRDYWLPDDVPFVLQSSVIIYQPIETVFGYIAHYQGWPDILAHVSRIEPEYDDGRLQNFRMHINELDSDDTYFVQSWRYVNQDLKIIDLSQPLPPKNFKIHKGGWRFRTLDDNRTELISYHGFDLLDTNAAESAIELIRKHIQAALKTWSRYGNGKADV